MHELHIKKVDNGYIVHTDNGMSVIQGGLPSLYTILEQIAFDPAEDQKRRALDKLREEVRNGKEAN